MLTAQMLPVIETIRGNKASPAVDTKEGCICWNLVMYGRHHSKIFARSEGSIAEHTPRGTCKGLQARPCENHALSNSSQVISGSCSSEWNGKAAAHLYAAFQHECQTVGSIGIGLREHEHVTCFAS